MSLFFFFNDTATTEIYTLSLHDALPISRRHREGKAPSGFGAAVEAIVLFVRNDVAIANIGHDGAKFAPYILTLFFFILRSEEHTSELQSPCNLVCRLLLEKKKKNNTHIL